MSGLVYWSPAEWNSKLNVCIFCVNLQMFQFLYAVIWHTNVKNLDLFVSWIQFKVKFYGNYSKLKFFNWDTESFMCFPTPITIDLTQEVSNIGSWIFSLSCRLKLTCAENLDVATSIMTSLFFFFSRMMYLITIGKGPSLCLTNFLKMMHVILKLAELPVAFLIELL